MRFWHAPRVRYPDIHVLILITHNHQGIIKDYKAQSIGKAMFSGEGWFVYKISGSGILWISSLGAIIRKDVRTST